MNVNMDDVNIGRKFLIKTIGIEFCRKHKDDGLFSYEPDEVGIYCFLGITLNPSTEFHGLSASLDEWDIYATCYVKDSIPTLGKCKLP